MGLIVGTGVGRRGDGDAQRAAAAAAPVVEEGAEDGQETMSHISNEPNIASERLLVAQT